VLDWPSMQYSSESPYGPPRVTHEAQTKERPGWVALGLFGVGSRRQAMAWFSGTLAGSVVSLFGVFSLLFLYLDVPVIYAAIVAFLVHTALSAAALWYWFCIRWMDDNHGW
jgi:hypothetical protein